MEKMISLVRASSAPLPAETSFWIRTSDGIVFRDLGVNPLPRSIFGTAGVANAPVLPADQRERERKGWGFI
jgi:hypothetical protein